MLHRFSIIIIFLALTAIFTLEGPATAKAGESKPIPPEAAEIVKKLLQMPSIDSIQETAIDGLYEVALPTQQIVYVYPSKKLIVAGQIFDATTGANLTEQRGNEIVTQKAKDMLAKVDKSRAIKIGSGPVELVEFTDVDCTYCRQSEPYFKDKDNIFTRYIFLLPNDNPTSPAKTRYILGSDDRVAAYLKALAGQFDQEVPKLSDSGAAKAEQGILYLKGIHAKLNIHATPTFVWSTGVMEGMNPKILDQLAGQGRQGGGK
jgi:thiol:disulfide interchange protein DsbC